MSLRNNKIKFFGRVSPEGRLALVNAKAFNFALGQFKGRPVILTLEEQHKTRTLEQNAFYWLYLTRIAEHSGDTPNALHIFFKSELLVPKFIQTTYGMVRDYDTTTKLTKFEFTQYLEKIRVKTGVPFPNEEAERLGYAVE